MTNSESRQPRSTDPSGTGGRRWRWRPAVSPEWSRPLVVVVLVGAVLALSGAFHTGEMPLLGRFAYWLGLLLGGALPSGPC